MAADDQNTDEFENEPTADLAEEISKGEIALTPTDTGDPAAIVEAKIPEDIRERYEIYSYRTRQRF